MSSSWLSFINGLDWVALGLNCFLQFTAAGTVNESNIISHHAFQSVVRIQKNNYNVNNLFNNIQIPKVVFSKNGYLLHMSRVPIPNKSVSVDAKKDTKIVENILKQKK